MRMKWKMKRMTKLQRMLDKIFDYSCVIGVVSLAVSVLLHIYGFVRYFDSYDTTSANYVRLEVAAPVLYNVNLSFSVVAFICVVICVTTMYMYKATKKKRR